MKTTKKLGVVCALLLGSIVTLASCSETNPPETITTTYSVTAGETNGATVLFSSTTAEEGDIISMTITCPSGKEVDTVTTNPSVTVTGSGDTYVFTMPASDVTVNVTLKDVVVETYSITIGETSGTTVTVNPENEAAEGTLVTVTVSDLPANTRVREVRYGLTESSVCEETSTANVYTFTMPARNVTLSVTLDEAHSVTVDIDQPTGLNLTYTVSHEYAFEGDVVTVELGDIPSGYELRSIRYNTVDLPTNSDGQYYFTMGSTNATVYVVVTALSYNFSVEFDSTYLSSVQLQKWEGFYYNTIVAGTTIPSGTKVKVNPSLREAYRDYVQVSKVNVIYNNEDHELTLDSDGYYTFTMPGADIKVEVETSFIEADAYPLTYSYDSVAIRNISVTNSSGASITSGSSVAVGETVNISLTLATGATITSVSLNEDALTATSGNNYSFTMPAQPAFITITTSTEGMTAYNLSVGTTGAEVDFFADLNGNQEITTAYEGQTVYANVWYNETGTGLNVYANDVLCTEEGSGYYSFTMPAQDVVITVESVSYYSVRFVNNSTKGSMALYDYTSGSQGNQLQLSAIAAGTRVQVEVYPATTSSVELYLNDERVTETADTYSFLFNMPSQNSTLRLEDASGSEEPATYTLTIENNADVNVSFYDFDSVATGNPANINLSSVTAGQEIYVDFYPVNAADYEVTINGVTGEYISDDKYCVKVVMPNANATIVINQKSSSSETYKLSYKSDISDLEVYFYDSVEGYGSCVSMTSAEAGSYVYVEVYSATTSTYFLYIDGKQITTTAYYGRLYMFQMPSNDVVLEIYSEPQGESTSFGVTIDTQLIDIEPTFMDSMSNTLNANGIEAGTEVTLNLWSGTYTFLYAYSDDVELTPHVDYKNTWTFTMPSSNVTISVYSEPQGESTSFGVTIDTQIADLEPMFMDSMSNPLLDANAIEAGSTVILNLWSETYSTLYAYSDDVELTPYGYNNTWTFTMPSSNVTISVYSESQGGSETSSYSLSATLLDEINDMVMFFASMADIDSMKTITSAKAGDTVYVYFSVGEDGNVGQVFMNGDELDVTENWVTFIMPAEDVVITYTYPAA